ncbi:MAG: DUF2207 domain-containing protein [Candidatus Rokubacteria bacterium]|nr:DUF2207 domain-containing protein [Candidatus Rokubacteria bacterium]
MRRLALGLAGLLVLAPAAAAQAGRWYAIEAFTVFLHVKPDSSLVVRETITFAFHGSHQGIYRTIPVSYARPGLDHALRVDRIQVTDGDGQPLRTEVSHPGRVLKIKAWVPGAEDSTRTVTIMYRVQRALGRFDDHEELYWNVTGNDWGAPIRRAEAVVELPPAIPSESVRTAGYTGPVGAVSQDWELDRTGNLVTFRTTRPLRMREGLTVVVGWAPGAVTFPSRAQELGWLLLDHSWLALPLLVLAGCLVVWSRAGRDPLRSRSIKPEYEPPKDLRPGEMGALVDETVNPRDLVATVVDLAVRGYTHIERVSDLLAGNDYLLTLKRPWLGEPDLRPFEVLVLAQIFGPGATQGARKLSELRRDSGAVVRPIRNQLYRDLVQQKHFLASPEGVRGVWRFAGIVVAGLFLTLWQTDTVSGLGAIAGIASGGIIAAFARAMPRKTFRGAAATQHVLGFQEFLQRAEKDRLARLAPDTLHKWLPYAIALGVEEAWIAGFEGLAVDAPTWYGSRTPFRVDSFSSEVRRLGQETQTAWLTSVRGGGDSAGGGGSGFSGGSSGGGFGGGGGGTF